MKSIKSQILVYLILVATLTFASLGYFSTKQLEKLHPYVESQYSEIVSARADELGKELMGSLEQVKMLSQSNIVQSLNEDEIMALLTSVNLENKFRNMTYVDINGKGRNTKEVEIDARDQEQYKEIILGDKDYWISDPFYSPFVEERMPIITVSHVIKKDGIKVGLINAVISTDFLDEVVGNIDIEGASFSWIVNSKGYVVAHESSEITIMDKAIDLIMDKASVDRIINEDSGTLVYNCEKHGKMMSSFSKIKNSPGWTFIVEIPYKQAFKEINNIIEFFKYMTIIYLILITIIVYLYSRTISRPIVNLKKVFERAANGELNVKADENINNELGQAGASFNIMLSHIKDLTYIDPVTELYNFNSFIIELPYKVRQLDDEKRLCSISIISIDDFKRINSIVGYEAGNQVLKELSSRVLEFSTKKELVARYFGDEIIVFLWDKDMDNLRNRIVRLWEVCGQPIHLDSNKLLLKTSMGVSILPESCDSYDEVIHEATLAKLKVKKSGGNGIDFYDEFISKEIKQEEDLDNAIYDAMNANEFYLVYQPIVNLKTNEIIANEALLRWSHEEYGTLPIPLVIELAEKKGYIEELGYWILKEACRQNKQWQDEGLGMMVISVNISVYQLEKADFIDRIIGALEYSKLEPKYLELEITETAAMANVSDKLELISKLKSLGIKISIDDFGTGYSSLSYFTKFPIDTLKIDKSFVFAMFTDTNAMTIIDTIVNMAKAMDVSITAEGVETVQHMDRLKELGCDKIQGYFISKPVKPLLLEALLRKLP